jgi:hypothetical protein
MAIVPRKDGALAEIEERLTTIYNQMRFKREDIAVLKVDLAKAQEELEHLDRMATEYVALLVAPQQEGIPA